MKQRFSNLDIRVIARELTTSLSSLRLVNIYDLSSRIFLLKFAKPDQRAQVVIESGFRCHQTSFARTTAASQSAFVSRLRKILKSRRLTQVKQVGTDRILEFQFQDGLYRLFLEFYAAGNIVLTDSELKVIALLRNVTDGATHEHLVLGSTYDLSSRQNVNGIAPVTTQRIEQALKRYAGNESSHPNAQPKKFKKRSGDELRQALSNEFPEFPPVLIDHALRSQSIDVNLQPSAAAEDAGLVAETRVALDGAAKVLHDLSTSENANGYIIGKHKTKADGSDRGIVYNEFHPFKPYKLLSDSSNVILEYDSFNAAVDEFFSAIEGQKLESKLQEKEDTARKKLDLAKQAQEKRIDTLQEVQQLNIEKAAAIQANLDRVSEATSAINSLIGQGMDWVEIDRLIEQEQKRGNPVANTIKTPLKLHENTATLLLGEMDAGSDYDESFDSEGETLLSDDESDVPQHAAPNNSGKDNEQAVPDKRLEIDIDLALSAWANAQEYYEQKKTAAEKQNKTILASSKALKSAQTKINADLQRALKQEKQVLRPVRQPFWFEKFHFFISSDGYIVLGGKDPMQREVVYRKHLRNGDYFVHADLEGAVPLVVKNSAKNSSAPIPPSTLAQAGNLSVCTSNAWDSKAVFSAWWVTADRVSKLAPTGDLLDVGKFHITGNKEYLPPAQLLIGFALLFQISPQSKMNHMKHRVKDSETTGHQEPHEADSAANSQEIEDNDIPDDEDTIAEEPGLDDENAQIMADEQTDDELEGDPYVNPLLTTNGGQRAVEQMQLVVGQPKKDNDSEDETSKSLFSVIKQVHQEPPPETQDSGIEQTTGTISQEPESEQKQPKKPNYVRGKKGKAKKIAAKYADQDEEDRAAAMKILGSTIGQERAAAEAKAREEKQREAEAVRQRKRDQHLKQQQERKMRETAKEIADDAEDDDQDLGEVYVDLETLVGTPLPGDEVLEVVPIAAPWSALGRCKYRAKIQPGNVKKGKAVREIIGKWTADTKDRHKIDEQSQDTEKIWPRERELIGQLRDVEAIGVLPVGKVRLMMPGTGGGGKAKDPGKAGKRGKK